MNTTVPDDSFNVAAASIMQTIGTAFTQGAAHQAEAARVQSDAQVRIAALQAETERDHAQTERLQLKIAGALTAVGLLGVCGLVVASFVAQQYLIASHVAAGAVGMLAGWTAGRAKR